MNLEVNIDNDKDPNNIFKILWDKFENKNRLPKYINKINIIDYNEFEKKIYSDSEVYAESIIKSLLSGDIILLKNTFNKEYLHNVKKIFKKKFEKSESSFHKIIEGCPNYFRNITPKLSGKYSFYQVKKTYYLFPWNKDNEIEVGDFYEQIYKRWRLLKYLSGFYKNAWEENTPKDGIVDRFQVAMYPSGSGEQELHQDPYLFQKFFISIYLSKKNFDYADGGIYLIDKHKNKIDLENYIDIGDMSFGFGTIFHGVNKVQQLNNSSVKSERWWIGLYSTVSDYVKNRHTGKPVDLKKIKTN
ncbi:MAG: hypothetical protein CBE33_05715 [Candidatus Pelagibacter sp. TMED273]|nr:MAG: hypothetical protein CBE33_05715 [Candidatus Pelagibacter sp. TMED273]|tara:strand:+ start:5032 stop:5934 length:903 start_codon:yes stop_codon:yes gene_type:complete